MNAGRLVAVLLALAAPAGARAGAMLVREGLAVRAGRWNAIHFTSATPGERVVVEAGGTEFVAEAGPDGVAEVLVLWPSASDSFEWGVEGEPREAVRIPVGRETTPTILVASDSEDLLALAGRAALGGRTTTAWRAGPYLPRSGLGYDAVDLLVLDRTPSPAEDRALADWISGGGVVVVAAPPPGRRASLSVWCQRWTACRFGERRLAERDDELVRLAAPGRAGPGPFEYVVVQPGTLAVPLAWMGGDPLLLVLSRGLGALVLLAFDPGSQPLSEWAGTPRLLERLEAAGSRIDPVPESAPSPAPAAAVRPLATALLAYGLALFPGSWLLARRRRVSAVAWLLPLPLGALGAALVASALWATAALPPVRSESAALAGREGDGNWTVHERLELYLASERPFDIERPGPLASDPFPIRRVVALADAVRLEGISGGLWTRHALAGRRSLEGGALRASLAIDGDLRVRGRVRNETGSAIEGLRLVVGRAWLEIGSLPHEAVREIDGALSLGEPPRPLPRIGHRPAWPPGRSLGALLVGTMSPERSLLACETGLRVEAREIDLPPGALPSWPAATGAPLAAEEVAVREFVLPADPASATLLVAMAPEWSRDPRLEISLQDWTSGSWVARVADASGEIDPAAAYLEAGTGRVRLRIANRSGAPLDPGAIDLGARLVFR